ncbi:hypothetical protein [Flavisolibacter ginsenosidimutans]|uniref:Glycosyltransferase n=1 Tax=Flavisolibacter ginsenosidimutans TaxID=661481 RepID=A0A5B8UNE3_9BACT|nr:hypothetical protein [Flavisolibacter ginsenosidimutans]QEC57495.1 hypothetical protein FSB75_16840 [Flavisolibacter ginsenosidimutans]
MNKDELVIATISLARNPEEERLLRASLPQLASLNVPVFVNDGGSPQSFLHFLRSLPNFIVLQAKEKGVFAQARNSLREAAKTERPFIFYTEPDKEQFFRESLPLLLTSVEVADTLGVCMASRSAKSFATFPAFQQMTETTINNCCKESIGAKTDYCYGPFLLNKKLVSFLDAVNEDIGWGWRPFVFNAAHRLGYKVTTFEKDFFCPENQRTDDAAERLYRMKQLEQNIRGLVLSAHIEMSPA